MKTTKLPERLDPFRAEIEPLHEAHQKLSREIEENAAKTCDA